MIVLDASSANQIINLIQAFLQELTHFALSQKFAVATIGYAQGLLIFGIKFNFIQWL